MKIVIDCYGADYSPDELVKGAITAVNLIQDLEIILTGKQEEIQRVIEEIGYKGDKLTIIDCPDVIDCNESPTMAIRQKKNSSLVVGLDTLKANDDIVGMISTGSTGAVLAGGLFRVGRMKNVLRPALSPLLPNKKGGKTLLIDCGANVDSKPEYLAQFAVMGSAYMESMFGIEKPRVALVNVGVEDKKGNDLTHAAFDLIKNIKEVNFVGNMEARDALSGDYDVLVCDGFVGNVLLKSIEGSVTFVTSSLKESIMTSGLIAKLGGLFIKKPLKKLKQRINYTSVGGSVFVGIDKILVKSHGSSKAETIFSCVAQVKNVHESGFIDKMREKLKIFDKESENNG